MTTGPGADFNDETAHFDWRPLWPGAANAAGPGQPLPTTGSTQPSGPAGTSGSWEPAGMPAGPAQPTRRRRRLFLIATAAVAFAVAAAGTAWAATVRPVGPLSTAAVAAKTDPALVDVTSTLGDRGEISKGTGIVLTSTGEVLTNNHVIAGATSVRVRDIGNGRSYAATVVGYSESSDVAVLQLHGASGLATAALGNSSDVRIGARVIALGNAGGRGGTPAVATGRVTATGSSITAVDQGDGVSERLTGLIRHNAPIQPGDSGGPLVSDTGQIIGMDTAASVTSPDGLGTTSSVATSAFAIPINAALSVARQIEAGQSSAAVHIGATAFLGVAVLPGNQQGPPGGSLGQVTGGAAVSGSLPGSAAAQAGLAAGDVIVSLGGHPIGSPPDLQRVIEGYHPGARIAVGWTDQFGQAQSATVTLTAGPAG